MATGRNSAYEGKYPGQESCTEPETDKDGEFADDVVSTDHVRVVVRCRPLNPSSETDAGDRIRISPDTKLVEIRRAAIGTRKYRFDCIADASKDQEYMFGTTGKHIVECALAGFNGAIVAYGQTGSGKTFTMQGLGLTSPRRSKPKKSGGIIQSVCEMIFKHVQHCTDKGSPVTFHVSASYLEIYNEMLIDLLATHPERQNENINKLSIREDSKGEITVVGQKSVAVNSPEECYKLLREGGEQRHVGATKMNAESSRSHAIFTLQIEKNDSSRGIRQNSRLHLVDLAGSERQRGTGVTGIRLAEANGINKSLSSLGNVVNALAALENSKGKRTAGIRIPSCRDSKLTFLLKDSLGGNSKLCIIATISPAASSIDETISTLEFAKRCTAVRNEAVVNESLTQDVQALQAEVLRLRQSLKLLRLNLSKAKASEAELRAKAQPSTRSIVLSRPQGNSCEPSRSRSQKETGTQTTVQGDAATGEKNVSGPTVSSKTNRPSEFRANGDHEDEDKFSQVERMGVLLADAISRERKSNSEMEELKRRFEDSGKRWREMLRTNEDLLETLKCKEEEIEHLKYRQNGSDGFKQGLHRDLEVPQARTKSNPEVQLLQSRIRALESELDNVRQSGSLSEKVKRSYEEKLSDSKDKWLEMLEANNILMVSLNERERILHEVWEKGLENVYDEDGAQIRKDIALIQREREKNPANALLRHRIIALERELLDFADISAQAHKEAVEEAQREGLGERSHTVDFSTEIGDDHGLSEEHIMKSLNEGADELEFGGDTRPKRGETKANRSNEGHLKSQINTDSISAYGILETFLEGETIRELRDCDMDLFKYEEPSPRRISELDSCIVDLKSSVMSLCEWAPEGGVNID